jgi:hypothetical protein
MQIALEELKELIQMRENVRRNTEALELCTRCQKISECQEAVYHDGMLVWLCQNCWNKWHGVPAA